MADQKNSVLILEDLHKKFGALVATNGVSLDVRQSELHALIGPNGAGKSTLIAQICGEISPDSGRILFDGQDITRLPAYKRARMGMGRSFQLTQLCSDFTAMENVLLSLEAKGGGSADIFRNPRRNADNRKIARTWLERVGLGEHENRVVASLAHGQRRQLEIAVALARDPRLILLDEPMAGMGPEESASLTALLQSLKRDYPILLIEHDMDAVFALADRISVLVYGKIIFTGTASEIRAHPEVRAAYLGEEA
ncbi:branched-chain amino acid transport system ATP-binding protein [Mesorhizobium soli]|uniref:ABC transporter ATP-binding protein n=1 Tax=Pseudaminobacter soli (ex Li et al. 2025) TaxID=1295366 RepID=UPI002476892D|nr:ABC transporter ATP-binding protein [Mesorhizobium soli]MDH6231640.1 branched-chain amino acid transport system ATP-binding protein [Mesorhizobium soli]